MAKYQNLINSISSVIRTNGNNEITGQILQDVLKSIVNVVGANPTYGGVAHPADNPGTPEGGVVYIASDEGTYVNFGGLTLADNELAVLVWDGTSWSKESVTYIEDLGDIEEAKQEALDAIAEAIQGLNIYYTIETDRGAAKDVQLKDGQGNSLMPKTTTDRISVNLYDSEKTIQQYLNDTDAIKHQCIFDEFIKEPGAEWSRMAVAVANKYDIEGYVTKIYFYAKATRYNAAVEYGILDITGSEFIFTSLGTAGIGGGLNIIELPKPIKVDSQHLLGFKNITYALTFQSTGCGSYYDNTYTSSVSWKYYFDYVTTLNEVPIEENDIQNKKINGGYIEAQPSYIGYNPANGAENPRAYQSIRWVVMFDDAEPGDILEIDCGDDYLTYPFILNREGNSELKRLLPTYVGGSNRIVIDFKATHDFPIKVLIKNSANTNINQTDVRAKVNVKLYKKYSDISNTPQKEISILFIGNSLTQDAVSYLPYLLNKYPSGVKFKLYIWYVGGFTLSQHLQYFQQDTPCDIFSVSEGTTRWVNFSNTKTMSQILQDYRFDLVCLQEYFNYKTEYSDADKQVYEDVIKYITDNHPQDNLKFITLFHQPKRDVAERVFNLTKSSIGWIMQNTITEAVLAPGIAIYRALSTSLDDLGDQGHLSPDGTHAQDGLPCVMQSYAILMWIYEKLGVAKSVYNMLSQPNTYDYTYINVPGPNIGSGLVTGTEEQLLLAQNVAIKAYKEGKALELANLTPYNS